MSMSRKDFEAIAAAIKGERMSKPENTTQQDEIALQVHYNTLDLAARSLADICAQSNPNFDRARFLKACGVEE